MTRALKKIYLRNFLVIGILFALFALLNAAGVFNSYIAGIITLIFINIVLAVSLNLTTGCLGQIALGHAGFMAIGAYTAVLFARWLNSWLNSWLNFSGEMEYVGYIGGLLLGGILAALIGLVIGIPALRLKGDYLAIITLGFGEIIRVIIENLGFTGGAQGLFGISILTTVTIAGIICIICVTLMIMLMRSRHGRAILSIRENDIAAESSGIHNAYYRTLAFSISAFFAGIAGGMYAHYIGVLGAKNFDFNKSIEILIIVVLGGLGSFTGSIIAAVFLTILPELLRIILGGLPEPFNDFTKYRILVYAIALIIIMLIKPSGIFGRYEFSLTRLLDALKGKKKHSVAPTDKEDKL